MLWTNQKNHIRPVNINLNNHTGPSCCESATEMHHQLGCKPVGLWHALTGFLHVPLNRAQLVSTATKYDRMTKWYWKLHRISSRPRLETSKTCLITGNFIWASSPRAPNATHRLPAANGQSRNCGILQHLSVEAIWGPIHRGETRGD